MVISLLTISQGMVTGYDVKFASDGTRRGSAVIPKPIVKTVSTIVKNPREHSLGTRLGFSI